jgi:NADH:ubiquinone oxidoreductase subunit C
LDLNFKLYINCILNRQNYAYISNYAQNFKNDNLILNANSLYYLVFHLRFSSLFYSTQLVDIFSYEVPNNTQSFSVKKDSNQNKFVVNDKGLNTVTTYNFHVINTQNRFFIFLQSLTKFNALHKLSKNTSMVSSIAELFFAANWLEREVSELHGTNFSGKKDLRNLMLQYGDTSTPFQKSFPSIGLKEMYYNPVKDTIVQNPVVLQI